MNKNIGFAITGSFCTFETILHEAEKLVKSGYNVLPIFSHNVSSMDTRFMKSKEFKDRITKLTGNKPVESITEAEPLGPQNAIDLLLIAPCTGNTMAKLANAITDTPVTMVAKAHLRNNKPVVIAISTNDALGLNMTNLARLITTKNIYFVPFGQDDFSKKPKSLVADMSKIREAIEKAFLGEQLQPILIKEKEK